HSRRHSPSFPTRRSSDLRVSVRPVELYSVEIWRGGVRQTVVPVSKPEITIGRGSKSVSVDLPIKGDPEVSRVHAVLTRDPAGKRSEEHTSELQSHLNIVC